MGFPSISSPEAAYAGPPALGSSNETCARSSRAVGALESMHSPHCIPDHQGPRSTSDSMLLDSRAIVSKECHNCNTRMLVKSSSDSRRREAHMLVLQYEFSQKKNGCYYCADPQHNDHDLQVQTCLLLETICIIPCLVTFLLCSSADCHAYQHRVQKTFYHAPGPVCRA